MNQSHKSLFSCYITLRGMLFIMLPLMVILAALSARTSPADAAGQLSVEVLAPYNLVVDSNVESPSTFGPALATVAVKVCNIGDATLNNVQAYIGDYLASTPGLYPVLDSSTLPAGHPLYNTGSYSLTHIGGSLGTSEATRFVGTLTPGQCNVQYWHFTYPRCENVGGLPDLPPCDVGPAWGVSNDPADDLQLNFDMWATADSVAAASDDWTVTMRNEISAMANKIEPNPNGQWFNTNSDTVKPGELITTNGINYELGNINQGFDNDGDGIPDYNAWMQPIGDADFDPSCFRLVRTHGVLHVARSGGLPNLDIPFEDQMYFTNLPPENNGVIGEIYYTFLALQGPCSAGLSPYQEVASGSENEKFNGDYGTGIPPIGSSAPELTLDKNSTPFSVSTAGGTVTYRLDFTNPGTIDAGLTLSTGGVNMPLVVADTVPSGLTYLGGSATDPAYNHLAYSPNTGFSVRYSTNSGATWSTTDPGNTPSTAPNNLVMIQWWMNDPVPAGSTGNYVGFQASIPGGATPGFVENCSQVSLGGGADMLESCATTMIEGTNSIGDYVWRDENSNGLQDDGSTGIDGVVVSLYLDEDDDGVIDSTDLFIQQVTTAGGGAYLFDKLPNGNYLVEVDSLSAAIPTGYTNTTASLYRVRGLGTTTPSTFSSADFGFGPALKLDKVQVSADPANEGDQVIFDIKLTNTLPATTNGKCSYMIWGTQLGPDNGGNSAQRWVIASEPYALGIQGPDGSSAYTPYSSGQDTFAATNFPLASAVYGSITKVEALYSIYVDESGGLLTNDAASFHMYWNRAQVTNAQAAFTSAELHSGYGPSAANQALATFDWTGVDNSQTPGGDGWQWADFTGALQLLIDADRTGGSDGAVLHLDAVGFRVTTDQTCGGANQTIAILPLTDDYDPARLQFVSADPAQDGLDQVNGLVTWNNLGPLYGGQTRTVRVTFTALDPGTQYASTDNVALVQNAYFGNGRPTNSPQDTEPVTVYRTAKIGDLIFHDANGNHQWDTGERGIPGTTVRLCDNATCSGVVYGTDITDASGLYDFVVRDGTYWVVVTDPLYATLSADPNGAPYTNNYQVTVAGADNLTIDFGYTLTRSQIYGRVWEDNNSNGSQQLGENGISAVTVWLCATSISPCSKGDQIGVATTDSNGDYRFTGIVLGNNVTYYVMVNSSTLPTAYSWSQTYDNDGNLNHQTPFLHTVPSIYGGYNFGYRHTPANSVIGDTIFTDWDGDGALDAGVDEGIQNVTVYLYEDANGDGIIQPANDALVATQVTDGNGNYLFTGVPAGNYIVVVDPNTLPDGYLQTKDPDQNGLCSICDNKDPINVNGTGTYRDEDFGYKPSGGGSIGDFVWKDTDGDGVQDVGEPGIDGIPVNLYEDTNANGLIDAADALIASTTTAGGGLYTFNNLYIDGASGQRYLVDIDQNDADVPVDSLGLKYILSAGNDPQLVTLSSATPSRTDIDFGFTAGGVIGDFVYVDANGSGQQDTGETGINDVVLTLYRDNNDNGVYDAGDTQVGSPVTTANNADGEPGYYQFTRLPIGDYVVVVTTPPPGFTLTGDPDATPICDPACDAQGSVWKPDGTIPYYGLGAGQIDRSQDFGYRPAGFIGDRVWNDLDGDGVQDPEEPGITNVTVELYKGGVLQRTTVTDGTGYYGFAGLVDGNGYEIRISTGTLPPGGSPTYDKDGTGTPNVTSNIVISGGGAVDDVDFGYRLQGTYSISGTVFYDTDQDGIYDDPGDGTYEGIPVYLFDTTGRLIATTTSLADGSYSFGNLGSGSYNVVVSDGSPQLEGTSSTTPTVQPVTIVSTPITDIDFGFTSYYDMGDLPSGYNLTTLADNGARHTIPAIGQVYLGSTAPDADADGYENVSAGGDDGAGADDEDGAVQSLGYNWAPGVDGGHVDLTVNGCPDTCYVTLWINWNGDSGDYDFLDSGERVLIDYPLTNGTHSNITFDVPENPADQAYFVRVRLYRNTTGGTASPNGLVSNGEVEDYRWQFGPTAIELLSLEASAQTSGLPLAIWLSVIMVSILGALLVVRTWRKRA